MPPHRFFTKRGKKMNHGIFITFAYLATIVAFFCCFFCLNFRSPQDADPDVQAFIKMRKLFGNVILIYCVLAVSFIYGLYALARFI